MPGKINFKSYSSANILRSKLFLFLVYFFVSFHVCANSCLDLFITDKPATVHDSTQQVSAAEDIILKELSRQDLSIVDELLIGLSNFSKNQSVERLVYMGKYVASELESRRKTELSTQQRSYIRQNAKRGWEFIASIPETSGRDVDRYSLGELRRIQTRIEKFASEAAVFNLKSAISEGSDFPPANDVFWDLLRERIQQVYGSLFTWTNQTQFSINLEQLKILHFYYLTLEKSRANDYELFTKTILPALVSLGMNETLAWKFSGINERKEIDSYSACCGKGCNICPINAPVRAKYRRAI